MQEPGTHKLAEALQGQGQPADPNQAGPPESGQPHPTPEQIAEDTRRQQEARSHGVPDRDDYLTQVGRGQQTHG